MSLAWTQKVKCEMKESSLYEQFTIYFFNMFVAREGREWTVVHPNSTPIDAYQSKVEWTVVHPNITPIDAYQSKVESGCGTSQHYPHRCLSVEGREREWVWYIPRVHPSMPITDSRKYSRDHSV